MVLIQAQIWREGTSLVKYCYNITWLVHDMHSTQRTDGFGPFMTWYSTDWRAKSQKKHGWLVCLHSNCTLHACLMSTGLGSCFNEASINVWLFCVAQLHLVRVSFTSALWTYPIRCSQTGYPNPRHALYCTCEYASEVQWCGLGYSRLALCVGDGLLVILKRSCPYEYAYSRRGIEVYITLNTKQYTLDKQHVKD